MEFYFIAPGNRKGVETKASFPHFAGTQAGGVAAGLTIIGVFGDGPCSAFANFFSAQAISRRSC